MSMSRRSLLGLAAVAPLAALAGAGARAAGTAACYDSASLPLSQRNRRRSLAYVETSAVAGKNCAACAFFTSGSQAGCGTCQLLSAGPVNASGLCNSFGAKAR